MPGVYVTDFRSLNNRSTTTTAAGLGQLPDDLDIDSLIAGQPALAPSALTPTDYQNLELEISELENSIHHLQRSNAEMQEYLAEGLDDSDHVLMDSIEENERLIQRKKQQVELYRQLLQQVDALAAVNPRSATQQQSVAGDATDKDDDREEKTND